MSLWVLKALHINLKTTSKHTIILNSCHLIAVAGRWFYHKLFSDSCICCSMAKRWTCFWLEPSAISSVDGAWAMLLPLRYSAIQWRGLFARGLDKTAHSNLQISASKCVRLYWSLYLFFFTPSLQAHKHICMNRLLKFFKAISSMW